MITIFIGYDEGEKIAYHVLCESIRQKSSVPVSFIPLSLNTIKEFTREKTEYQSTDFAFSRFMTPYYSKYRGWSLFMDCDMLVRVDINQLWEMKDDNYAVMVCQHDYVSSQNIKFRGATNQSYPKKNWSSMMLINNEKCTNLTPDYVNTATGSQLHRFEWLENENLIGSIPLEWNWLVGEYSYNSNAKIAHYTLGGPYFKDYKDCDYSDEWFDVYNEIRKIDL